MRRQGGIIATQHASQSTEREAARVGFAIGGTFLCFVTCFFNLVLGRFVGSKGGERALTK